MGGLVHVDIVAVLEVDPEENKVRGDHVAQVAVVRDVCYDRLGNGKLSRVVPKGRRIYFWAEFKCS